MFFRYISSINVKQSKVMEKNLPIKKKKKKKMPEKCISVEEARELHGNWCEHRGKHLKECLGHDDAKDFWWSVEELQEYLKYVKRESRKQGIDNPGIRVYLGAYSKDKCNAGKGYSTLFFKPTGSPVGAQGKGGNGQPDNDSISPYNRAGQGGGGNGDG